ncbi:hypothetical protein Tsp_04701 [Trichinella spiralis]|uniref:hypothetical protein n=1 Tax=Trichinella spiralis TaxID=6334 RepID=UPI0001EFD9DA|nr:hypothetical protein Tsp_04701 [Trichinella spiralis]
MALKKCSTLISLRSNLPLPVATGIRKLRYVLRRPFHVYNHHLFAAPPSGSYPVHQRSVVVLSCAFVHAAAMFMPTFQMVVRPHRHTMNVPKRNFSGRKPLLLEILEQGFHLTRRPNIYDFETRGYKVHRQKC